MSNDFKLSQSKAGTLGYHYDMSKAILGEDSKATKYLAKKIDEAPNGRDEEVIADERQVVGMLFAMHNNDEE